MKNLARTLLAASATLPIALPAPALAQPTVTMSGELFTRYQAPIAAPQAPDAPLANLENTRDYNLAMAHRFDVTRAFLTGTLALDPTWSGVMTYDMASNALTMAYVQSRDLLVPGTSVQLGIVYSPWTEYEISSWGYRMLGELPINGGLFGIPSLAGPQEVSPGRLLWTRPAYVQPWDKGLRLNGSHDLLGMGLSWSAAVLNGEGYASNETAGRKALEGRLTLSPLPGLELTGLIRQGNPDPNSPPPAASPVNNPAKPTDPVTNDAAGGWLTYRSSWLRAGVGYTAIAQQTVAQAAASPSITANGNLWGVWGVVPLDAFLPLPFPLELIARHDAIVDPFDASTTSATSTSRTETTLGVALKPAKGLTIVLDDQLGTATRQSGSGAAATTQPFVNHLVAVHSAFVF